MAPASSLPRSGAERARAQLLDHVAPAGESDVRTPGVRCGGPGAAVDPPPRPPLPVHRTQGTGRVGPGHAPRARAPSRSRRACGVAPGRPLARAANPPRSSLPSRAAVQSAPPQRRRTSLPSRRGCFSSGRPCSSFPLPLELRLASLNSPHRRRTAQPRRRRSAVGSSGRQGRATPPAADGAVLGPATTLQPSSKVSSSPSSLLRPSPATSGRQSRCRRGADPPRDPIASI
jgi:hypothetical protein